MMMMWKIFGSDILVWGSFRERGARLLCDEYCESLAKEVLTEYVRT